MKRVITFIFMAVLLAIITPFSLMFAQPARTPHQNPAIAADTSDIASLLNIYSNIFNLAALRQCSDAQSMLNELKHANIPGELRYLTDRFNALSQKLFTAANNLEFLLDKASTLFLENKIIEARQILDSSEVVIRDTLLLMDETEAAASAIADTLGVFTVLVGSEIEVAYQRLYETLHNLRQTLDELSQLRERISDNPQMKIETHFYLPTQLELSVPETAYPGLPFTVNCEIINSEGTVDRLVKIFLDDIQLAEEIVQGRFSFEITSSQQIPLGKHSMVAVVAPKDRYSGVSKSAPINISKLPIKMDIQMPRVTFFSGSIEISGTVYNNLGPLEGARVDVSFKDNTTVATTSGKGKFVTDMRIPFSLSIIGPQEVAISVKPSEAWYSSLEVNGWIFNINAVNTGLMLVVLASLGIIVYTRIKVKPRIVHQELGVAEVKIQKPVAVTPSPIPGYELTSIKGKILSAYLKAMKVVEKVTGISMEPHTTIREFLSTSAYYLPQDVDLFTELTAMAEIALYSGYDLPPDEADKAEQIAASITEELGSGNA